jgi:hypothetical protein
MVQLELATVNEEKNQVLIVLLFSFSRYSQCREESGMNSIVV